MTDNEPVNSAQQWCIPRSMQLSRSDLADFTYFLAIARHGSFKQAAIDMGVTTSAISHAITALEGRRGVRLFNRTTRSVTLTAAGEELQAMIEGPVQAITAASEHLDRYRDAPAGRIRINVLEDAVSLLLEPIMPTFVDRYPDVAIDICVSNRMVDVIAGGFDAGIRYGGTVPEDMIAQRLSPDIRWMAAASPAYLDRFGVPTTPEDLSEHRCVGIRLGNDQVYQWEFERDGSEVAVTTPGPLTVDASHAAIAFGLCGAGIVYATELILGPYFSKGALRPVLEDWATTGSGFHIYYSGRRHLPTGLRLLIDLVRELQPVIVRPD